MMQRLSFESDYPFEIDIPDGRIDYHRDFMIQDEAKRLLQILRTELLWREDDIKMFGKTYKIPRLQAWYGDPKAHYKYSGIDLPLNPWDETLYSIKTKIENLTGDSYNSVLANWYRDGQDSNGWHADDEKELGKNPIIASVSLGSERVFQMKHRTEKSLRKNILLEHGSLLIMRDQTQHFWLHQIAKSKKVTGDRINLTFRKVILKSEKNFTF